MTKKIKLIDVDSIIPNLALMKLSTHYKSKGYEVGFNIEDPDKVFISVLFPKNRADAVGRATTFDCEVKIGGTGYRFDVKLPREIEFIPPDYSLYQVCNKCGHIWIEKKPRNCYCKNRVKVPMFYSIGFTSRGCVRNCSFCIVRKKEGNLNEWDDIHNFHTNGFDTVMLLDNNLLACEFPVCGACIGSSKQELWEYILGYFVDSDTKLWEHGLDIRYMTKKKAEYLSRCKPFKQWHFAFDYYQIEKQFRKGMQLLIDNGVKGSRVMVYVLAFYNTGYKDALKRIHIVEEYNADPYVMPFRKPETLEEAALVRWCNNYWVHGSLSFEDYLNKVKSGIWKKNQDNGATPPQAEVKTLID